MSFGLYSLTDGTTIGEMSVQWVRLDERVYPMLRVFDDGWKALGSFDDLLSRMADVSNQAINPGSFCGLLTACGFIDRTPLTVS